MSSPPLVAAPFSRVQEIRHLMASREAPFPGGLWGRRGKEGQDSHPNCLRHTGRISTLVIAWLSEEFTSQREQIQSTRPHSHVWPGTHAWPGTRCSATFPGLLSLFQALPAFLSLQPTLPVFTEPQKAPLTPSSMQPHGHLPVEALPGPLSRTAPQSLSHWSPNRAYLFRFPSFPTRKTQAGFCFQSSVAI